MKWKYTRIQSAKCSKWVCGDNWVIKYDDEKFCHVGINEKPNCAWMIESPNEARKSVESFLANANADLPPGSAHESNSGPVGGSRIVKRDRPWHLYPNRTIAVAPDGGHYVRENGGWKWCSGDTFPNPSADVDRVILPENAPVMAPGSAVPDSESTNPADR